jgi:hypothetical protein
VTHQEAVETLATERYLLDDMPDEDRPAFEEHFFACEVCADDLRVAAAMLQGAKAGYAGQSAPGRVVPMVPKPEARRPAWYRSTALPWAAAASLALVTGYQSLWVVPNLARNNASPLALVPVSLRPASRGSQTIVPLASNGGSVALALEINEATPGSELVYDLASSDGRHIVSGRAAAPGAGIPLFLLMPSWTLVGPMDYILSVHEAGSSARLLGEYRFTVSPQ